MTRISVFHNGCDVFVDKCASTNVEVSSSLERIQFAWGLV